MDLLRAGLSAAAAAKPLPTFKGVPFNPAAFATLVSSFVQPDGPQLGSVGRRVSAFSPSLVAGPTPTYFGNRVCPWAHRAFLALAEKGPLDKIDYVHIDLKAPKPAWYQEKVCPPGTVPCIVDNGVVLWESSVVMEYVDERFPGPPQLLPTDPRLRALARMFVKAVDGGSGVLYGAVRNRDESLHASKRAEVKALLAGLEARYRVARAVQAGGGPFFFGATPSIADISIVTLLARFDVLLRLYRGWDVVVSPDDTPLLAAMYSAYQLRRAFAETTPEPEFLAAAAFDMAGGVYPTAPESRL